VVILLITLWEKATFDACSEGNACCGATQDGLEALGQLRLGEDEPYGGSHPLMEWELGAPTGAFGAPDSMLSIKRVGQGRAMLSRQ
jgi:hypothetical protein